MKYLEEYEERFKKAFSFIDNSKIEKFALFLDECRKKERNILVMGNGGSMSLASHFAEDMNKGIVRDKNDLDEKRFRCIPLSDISTLTAYGNDVDYESVFSQQIINYARKGDVIIVISASGNSPNIIKSIETAKKLRVYSFGLLGFDGGKAKNILDDYILVETDKGDYRVAEDLHLHIVHKIIEYLERDMQKE